MLGVLLQTSVYNYITSPYMVWLPVASAAALAIIGILAIVYMLTTFTGNRRMATWTRVKIYEVVFSFILIGAFAFVVVLLTSVNFVQLFGTGQDGLVPVACSAQASPPIPSNDLFTLAVCNMHAFVQHVTNIGAAVYWIGAQFAFVPSVEAAVWPVPGVSGFGVQTEFTLIPRADEVFLAYAIDLIYITLTVAQLQVLLLAASLLIFSFFMAIGLIARLFVITRSFGGALIAFAVGLGIVYPLLVAITYGYVNVGMQNTGYVLTWLEGSGAMGGLLGLLMIVGVPALAGSAFSGVTTGITGTALLTYLGLTIMGLVFVPILTFVLVDVFIIDFSTAVGEKMDFLSLLTNVI